MTHSRDPQHEQAASQAADGTPGWPGGWYVYENGRVDGPYTAEDAFKLDAETSEGKPRLVSRKGFSQWYALRDLSEIFKMTEQMGRKAQEVASFSEAQLAGAAAKVATQPVPAASLQAKPLKKQLKAEGKQETARPVAPVEILAAPHAVERFDAPSKDAWLETPAASGSAVDVKPSAADLAYPSVAPASMAPGVAKAKSKAKPKAVSAKAANKAALMQEYFLARGRLRLGKMRNPWITAFVGLPMTIGTLWFVWMRDVGREVSFHARNSDKTAMPPAWLAMVPFVHMVMTYKLAKLVVEMEAQNKYRSVSPLVATLFSVFPPFAMAYLQDAVNRHWLLHVRHVVAKKRGADA